VVKIDVMTGTTTTTTTTTTEAPFNVYPDPFFVDMPQNGTEVVTWTVNKDPGIDTYDFVKTGNDQDKYTLTASGWTDQGNGTWTATTTLTGLRLGSGSPEITFRVNGVSYFPFSFLINSSLIPNSPTISYAVATSENYNSGTGNFDVRFTWTTTNTDLMKIDIFKNGILDQSYPGIPDSAKSPGYVVSGFNTAETYSFLYTATNTTSGITHSISGGTFINPS
jgi:hypothetical protein